MKETPTIEERERERADETKERKTLETCSLRVGENRQKKRKLASNYKLLHPVDKKRFAEY